MGVFIKDNPITPYTGAEDWYIDWGLTGPSAHIRLYRAARFVLLGAQAFLPIPGIIFLLYTCLKYVYTNLSFCVVFLESVMHILYTGSRSNVELMFWLLYSDCTIFGVIYNGLDIEVHDLRPVIYTTTTTTTVGSIVWSHFSSSLTLEWMSPQIDQSACGPQIVR